MKFIADLEAVLGFHLLNLRLENHLGDFVYQHVAGMEAVEQSQGLRAELFRIAQSVVLGAVTGGIVPVDHGAIEITDLLLYITIDRRYQSSSLKVLKKNTIIDRSFMTNRFSFSNSLVFQPTFT